MRVARLATVALGVAAAGACREARVSPEGAAEARELMLSTVAARFREPSAALGVLEFEPVTWQDACLEIRRRGACPEEPTAGYRLRLNRHGEAYEYRATAADPADVALASAPDPRLGTPALSWSWETAPGGCRNLLVSHDGRPAIGWCDGPIAGLDWLEAEVSGAEWSYLYGRFAPFERRADDHALAFTGTGSEKPAPAWQEAMDRWARVRWSELHAGRRGAAHGRALAYRRPVRDREGSCDVLEVTEYGVAYLGRARCEGGGGEPGRAVWLSDSLWEEMNGWLESWAPRDTPQMGFYGRGQGRPDERALERWADLAMAHAATEAREAWPSPQGR